MCSSTRRITCDDGERRRLIHVIWSNEIGTLIPMRPYPAQHPVEVRHHSKRSRRADSRGMNMWRRVHPLPTDVRRGERTRLKNDRSIGSYKTHGCTDDDILSIYSREILQILKSRRYSSKLELFLFHYGKDNSGSTFGPKRL